MSEGEHGEGETPQQPPRQGNKRLQQTQAQVDEVVEIMKFNLDKVLERDSKLSNLDDRADALQEGASQFEKSAATLKSKMWWKNMKMMLIIGGIVAIIIIILVGQYVIPKSEPAPEHPTGTEPSEQTPAAAAPIGPHAKPDGDGGGDQTPPAPPPPADKSPTPKQPAPPPA